MQDKVIDIALPFGLLTVRVRDNELALTLGYWEDVGEYKAKERYAKDIPLPHTSPVHLRAGWMFISKT